MTQILYSANSFLIAAILLVIASLVMECGYRLGRKRQLHSGDPIKSQFTAIQGSLLGLVSLLLGFTFNIAIHHYDNRSEAMVEETNAIGTTYLRARSLPDTVRNETLATLGKYVDVRVQCGQSSVADEASREPLLQEASQLRIKLWDLAMRSVKDDDRVTTSGLYVQTLNDLIDSYGTRDEILNRHIPEIVIFLLLITFVLAGGILGYTSGVSGHRPTMAVMGFMVIVVILVSMIMDLDRPHVGLSRSVKKICWNFSKRSEIHIDRDNRFRSGGKGHGL